MSFQFIRSVALVFCIGILLPTATLSVSNEASAKASAANANKKKAKGKTAKGSKSKAKAPQGKAAKTVQSKAMPPKGAKDTKDAKATKAVTKAPVKAPVKTATAPSAQPPNLTDVSFPDQSATGPWVEMLALFVLICLGAFLVYRRKKAGAAGGGGSDLQHSKPETAFGSDLASLDLDRLRSSGVKTLSQQASKLSKHG